MCVFPVPLSVPPLSCWQPCHVKAQVELCTQRQYNILAGGEPVVSAPVSEVPVLDDGTWALVRSGEGMRVYGRMTAEHCEASDLQPTWQLPPELHLMLWMHACMPEEHGPATKPKFAVAVADQSGFS